MLGRDRVLRVYKDKADLHLDKHEVGSPCYAHHASTMLTTGPPRTTPHAPRTMHHGPCPPCPMPATATRTRARALSRL